jgi:trafficking protein particle complex subunit 8
MRTLDWMSARISARCARWVEDMEKAETAEKERSVQDGRDVVRTPWWDELRRCAEGECVPNRAEGWNHPSASMYSLAINVFVRNARSPGV